MQLVVRVLPAALVVTPQTVTFAHQTDTQTQTVSVSETDYSDRFDIDANDCTSRHVATFANAVGIGNPGTFTVAADPSLKGGNATCTIAVFDHATNPEGSMGAKSVMVSVNDAVCTQSGDPKDAPMLVNGQSYVSTGIACGQYNYILGGGIAVQFTQTGLSGPDQTAIDACAAAGQLICALPDGTHYCATGGSVVTCALTEFGGNKNVPADSTVTTGNQGAQAYPGVCTDFQSPTGCTVILAGGNGGSGPVYTTTPLPVLIPTLVDIFSADAEQNWNNCFVSSATSQYPPNSNTQVVYIFDRTNWPKAALDAYNAGLVAQPNSVCPEWAPS